MNFTANLRPILNAFRICGRRAREVGQPSLTVWTDAGETAARDFGDSVARSAHAAKVHDDEARSEIEAGLAGLADGRADAADVEHFRRAARLVAKSAELDEKIGEAVAS